MQRQSDFLTKILYLVVCFHLLMRVWYVLSLASGEEINLQKRKYECFKKCPYPVILWSRGLHYPIRSENIFHLASCYVVLKLSLGRNWLHEKWWEEGKAAWKRRGSRYFFSKSEIESIDGFIGKNIREISLSKIELP